MEIKKILSVNRKMKNAGVPEKQVKPELSGEVDSRYQTFDEFMATIVKRIDKVTDDEIADCEARVEYENGSEDVIPLREVILEACTKWHEFTEKAAWNIFKRLNLDDLYEKVIREHLFEEILAFDNSKDEKVDEESDDDDSYDKMVELFKRTGKPFGHDKDGKLYLPNGETIDLCDCLKPDCIGCSAKCLKCKSRKCSHTCRNDRKEIFVSVTHYLEGETEKYTINPWFMFILFDLIGQCEPFK